MQNKRIDIATSGPTPPPAGAELMTCLLTNQECPIADLKEALAREELLIKERDKLIGRLTLLGRESDHRLLNNLQMIVSLLSLQSRTSASPEVALQLGSAANRVAMVERVHRRLHSMDGARIVEFREYLQEFCREYAALTSPEGKPEREITIEAKKLNVPASIAVPLGFIVNELVTNATKYGQGRIVIALNAISEQRNSLSVSNDGQPLPGNFGSIGHRGLGMTIVRSFVKQIGGSLMIDKGDETHGPIFTVYFCN